MIAKRLRLQNANNSDASRLIAYLTDDQKNAARLGPIRYTHLASEDPVWAAAEFKAVSSQNHRAVGDRTYHLLVSFPVGENPSAEVIHQIEDALVQDLGFSEHQRVSVVHRDTDNLHVHVAINKIHPVHLTLHEPYYDYVTLAKSCERVEIRFGLQPDNHQPVKTTGRDRADDMEKMSGEQSLAGWIERDLGERIQGQDSWEALHGLLTEHGLTLRVRGNGLVFEDSNGLQVRASTVSRAFSKKKLEERLGTFKPAVGLGASPTAPSSTHPTVVKQYEKSSVVQSAQARALFERYSEERQRLEYARMTMLKSSFEREKEQLSLVYGGARLRHRLFVRPSEPGFKPWLSKGLHRETAARARSIRQTHQDARSEFFRANRRTTFKQWLRLQASQGEADALACLRGGVKFSILEGRMQANALTAGSPLKTITTAASAAAADLSPDSVGAYVTGKGARILLAGTGFIKDYGERVSVSDQFDEACIVQALSLAQRQSGNTLTLTGSAAFQQETLRVAQRLFPELSLKPSLPEGVESLSDSVSDRTYFFNITKLRSYNASDDGERTLIGVDLIPETQQHRLVFENAGQCVALTIDEKTARRYSSMKPGAVLMIREGRIHESTKSQASAIASLPKRPTANRSR